MKQSRWIGSLTKQPCRELLQVGIYHVLVYKRLQPGFENAEIFDSSTLYA